MIRISVQIILYILCFQSYLYSVSPKNRRLMQHQPLLQSQIQNCSIPDASTPNLISLGMCPNQTFIMPMSIGTPSQPLFFIPDTSQVFIQVLTNQTNQTGFVISQSSTLSLSNDVVEIELGNGQTVNSQIGNDIVGLSTNISTRCDLLIVNQQVQNQYSQVISGVVGLGISNIYNNIFEMAYSNSIINTASFIMSLNMVNQSYIYYNDLPSQIIDQSIFISSRQNTEFALTIIGLFVGETEYTSGAPDYAVISSGNNYFYLNSKVYNAVTSNFFSSCIQTTSGPSCSCNDVPNWPVFSIMFIGAQIYIPGNSYAIPLPDGNCTYGFGYVQNDDDLMVLGTSFFVNYNITIDPIDNKIGMQGHLTPIQVINFGYFVALQYVFFVVAVFMAIAAGVLAWYIKVIEKEKPSRIIEFSISDRFIETD